MSSVSDRMRARTLSTGGSGAPGSTPRTLADLGPGERATVAGYCGDVEAGTTRRLFDLGLVPGVEVEMVRRAPLRDPVIYRVGDYEIALRKAQSSVIYVEGAR